MNETIMNGNRDAMCPMHRTKAAYAGNCSWHGTIEEFLRFNRGEFVERMKGANSMVSPYGVGHPHFAAWRDMFRHLKAALAKLPQSYRGLHLAFEYAIPGHPQKETGEVLYEKRPDVILFSADRVLVLEFKQREAPPYDGFAMEARSYLRLLEKWHPSVPRMSASGALVLTLATNFGKRYPRVRAISPDRIPAAVRRAFGGHLVPCADPTAWLLSIADGKGA